MADEQHRKEINTSLAKPLAYAAGILGLIQGIAWFVFSILCVLCYFECIQVDTVNGNETEYYKIMYEIFLQEGGVSPVNETISIIVKPKEFVIFMWFYIIFSAVWTCASGSIIWAMIHNQWQLAKTLFGAWSTTTILTSIVDIVFTGLIVADYVTISKNVDSPTILVTYGIVMSLAARGYILWIINVIIAAIMAKFTIDLILNENHDTIPIIHGYESNDVNPPWFNGSVKDFWASPQNGRDNTDSGYDNQGFRRSRSFSPMNITNEHIYSTPPTENYSTPVNNTNYKSTIPANNAYSSPPTNMYKPPPTSMYKTPTNVYKPPTSNNNNYSNVTPGNNAPTSFSEAIAQRTATIGRNKGRRSPLNHVSPPVIPDPDYTPPNSPGLKSVLRSKSNYN